jgi:hypothetical protein
MNQAAVVCRDDEPGAVARAEFHEQSPSLLPWPDSPSGGSASGAYHELSSPAGASSYPVEDLSRAERKALESGSQSSARS